MGSKGKKFDKAVKPVQNTSNNLIESFKDVSSCLSPEVLKFARKYGLNVNSLTSKQVLDNLDMSVSDFISKFRKGSINREFPSEFLQYNIKDAISKGDSKVKKLLTDSRFSK